MAKNRQIWVAVTRIRKALSSLKSKSKTTDLNSTSVHLYMMLTVFLPRSATIGILPGPSTTLEQFYSTQIDEMPMNVADLI